MSLNRLPSVLSMKGDANGVSTGSEKRIRVRGRSLRDALEGFWEYTMAWGRSRQLCVVLYHDLYERENQFSISPVPFSHNIFLMARVLGIPKL